MGRRLISVVAIAALAAFVGIAAVLGGALRSTTPSSRAACTPKWHVVARTGVQFLADVDALSANRVWAVGGTKRGSPGLMLPWRAAPVVEATRPVIVTWNGRRLATRVFPWKGAALTGVSAVSPRDVWAVGSAATGPLVVHWNGSAWSREELPPQPRARLTDVIALAADDIWAVGAGPHGPLAMHSDGRRWRLSDLSRIAPRGSELASIDAVSPDDIWAVGSEGMATEQEWLDDRDLVVRWDGARWRRVASPLYAAAGQPNFAQAVDVAPSGDVWTVNQYSDYDPWFVRWSAGGHSSASVDSWNAGSEIGLGGGPIVQISDLEAVSTTAAWAVGQIDWAGEGWDDLSVPLIGHWDGTSWRPQHTGLDALKGASLGAISAVSSTDMWAVGPHAVVRYSC